MKFSSQLPEKILKKIRHLNRRQILKIAGVGLVLYLVVWMVNFAVLWSSINTNNARISSQRNTVDRMVPGLRAGSRLLDSDLRTHKAIGRVGDYYLLTARFDQLGRTQKSQLGSLKIKDDQAMLITANMMNRMITEPLVYQYAKDHNLKATDAEIGPRLAANVIRNGSTEKLVEVLKKTYNWSLQDFKNEIEYTILRAKMEEALGGKKYAETSKGNLQAADFVKVKDYADKYARTHTNYLLSGGYKTLAKRFTSL